MENDRSQWVRFAFFGCRGGAGHFLTLPDRSSVRDATCAGLPRESDLDGSHLFLPYPENVGEGRRTYLPALNLTVLSWWNRVFDERGAVNSHVMARGDYSIETAWAVFEYQFKDIAPLHKKPIIGQTY